VPSGGILGGLIGAIEGATEPHIPMQGGAISRVLLQSGCISPSTHWQVHPASTCELNAHKAKVMITRILIDTPFSKAPSYERQKMKQRRNCDSTGMLAAAECRAARSRVGGPIGCRSGSLENSIVYGTARRRFCRRHQQALGLSPSGSRRLSIARSMAECALAKATDCSAMSLFAVAICAPRAACCVKSRWSRIVDSLLLPLNRSQLCFKIVP
jgi:hypothetical protein